MLATSSSAATEVNGTGPSTPTRVNAATTRPQPTKPSISGKRARPPTAPPRPHSANPTSATAARPISCSRVGGRWGRIASSRSGQLMPEAAAPADRLATHPWENSPVSRGRRTLARLLLPVDRVSGIQSAGWFFPPHAPRARTRELADDLAAGGPANRVRGHARRETEPVQHLPQQHPAPAPARRHLLSDPPSLSLG